MRSQPVADENWMEAVAHGVAARQHLAGPDQRRQELLARAVQDAVIPQLVQARRAQKAARPAPPPMRPGPAQVDHLTRLALGGGQAECDAYVQALRYGGTPVDVLYLELLTPAARLLGRLWEDDTCSFSDVTLGMVRLSHVMRWLGHAFAGDRAPQLGAPSALLVQMPGEQHGFGLAMVSQFFRRAGWRVRVEPVVTSDGLAALVGAQPFRMVGISVSCSDRLDRLAADIRAIRRNARNRGMGVMVGGLPFLAHPQLASLVGADATAVDGRQAVLAAAGWR